MYRWVPLTNSSNRGKLDNIEEQILRARLFCESYGLSLENSAVIPDLIIERLEALIKFMLTQASKGSDRFKSNIENKHHLLYLNNIEYIKLNKPLITSGLTKRL
ncbi:MAG: hypothetical protein ACRYE9_04505 [Janthinobacterium lividum]